MWAECAPHRAGERQEKNRTLFTNQFRLAAEHTTTRDPQRRGAVSSRLRVFDCVVISCARAVKKDVPTSRETSGFLAALSATVEVERCACMRGSSVVMCLSLFLWVSVYLGFVWCGRVPPDLSGASQLSMPTPQPNPYRYS